MSEEVRLLEIITQKDAQIRQLQAANELMSQELKLLKEKVDLLIRRIFGSKSEKLDLAQLELLLKEDQSGKADASALKGGGESQHRSSKASRQTFREEPAQRTLAGGLGCRTRNHRTRGS